MSDKIKITFILSITLIICSLIFSQPYEIKFSNKANCDILLNKRSGVTWYNKSGFWEKSTTNIEKYLR